MLTIVMPSYNEAASLTMLLPGLVDFCGQQGFKLVIVDDGSTDDTLKVVEKYVTGNEVELLSHKINKGYGAALKTGFLHTTTPYVISMDADGQHSMESVLLLFRDIRETDADMIIGSRFGENHSVKTIGKKLIRMIARILINMKNIRDLNSGMKIYRTELVQKYLTLCPDSMAFSDTIVLAFVSFKHYVKEVPIQISKRTGGRSKIHLKTAFETVYEILNMVMLFNPIRIFVPVSLLFILLGLAWGIPIMIQNKGVSVGSALLLLTGSLTLLLGLIAQQVSLIRRDMIKR